MWLCYAGGDSHLDQLSPSLLGRGQGSALSRCACAQCIADSAAPRPRGVMAPSHRGFNQRVRRFLQESGRVLEAAGCAQGCRTGSTCSSSVGLPGRQFLLLRGSSSNAHTSQWGTRGFFWAALLQPACEDAASDLSSPVHSVWIRRDPVLQSIPFFAPQLLS